MRYFSSEGAAGLAIVLLARASIRVRYSCKFIGTTDGRVLNVERETTKSKDI